MTLQKQTLVGFLSPSAFSPGEPIQLLIAIVVTLLSLLFVGWFQPYRKAGLNFLAHLSSTSLQFIFIVFLSFGLANKCGIKMHGFVHDAVFNVGCLFVAALGVVFVALFARLVIFDRLHTVH